MARSNGPVGGGPELLLELDRDDPRCRCTSRSSARSATTSAPAASPPGRGCPRAAALAGELGVSRGVVTEAYGQLAAEGYLHTRQGAPVRVAQRGAGRRRRARRRARCCRASPTTSTPACPTSPASPATAGCARCARPGDEAPIDAVGYADPRGVPELREALAEYLGPRARRRRRPRAHCSSAPGSRQGLSLLCRWLRQRRKSSGSRSRTRAGTRHRLIVEQAGLEVVPVPVDDEGLRVDAARARAARRR